MICLCYLKQTPKTTLEYRYKKPQFIKRGVDRIKRLSYEVLDEHQSKFGEDFAGNKKVLDQISIIRSKGLKNEVAGYITKFIKKQIREEKVKQAQRSTIQTETNSETEPIQEENIDAADVAQNVEVEVSETSSETESVEEKAE